MNTVIALLCLLVVLVVWLVWLAWPRPLQLLSVTVRGAMTDAQIRRACPVCADFYSFRAGVRAAEMYHARDRE